MSFTTPPETFPKPVPQSDRVAPASERVAGNKATRRVPSFELFADAQELEIEHNGALYRLRQTSLGKLILTK
jgi:hemin uptake protein HemP